jgi:hypothetical protein
MRKEKIQDFNNVKEIKVSPTVSKGYREKVNKKEVKDAIKRKV